MHKYLLILFLISAYLMASNQNDVINIKTKVSKDIVKVKMLIHSSMRGAKKVKEGNKEDYINHVSVRVGNYIVYDASLSENLKSNPIIEFEYPFKNRGKTLEFITTNNQGKKSYQTKKIKHTPDFKQLYIGSSKEQSFINYRDIKPDLWKKQTVNEAIVKLYGHTKTIDGKIEICSTPEGPYHTVNVNVRAHVLLESLLILTDTNPSPVVALFHTTLDELINYKVPISMLKSGYGHIIVIGKGLDGKLYKTSHKVNVWTASCDGGGDNEVICHY